MPIALQDGIDLASTQPVDVQVTISMHNDSHLVMFGFAAPSFQPDIQLQSPQATIGGGWGGGRARARQIPGFTTRGFPRPGPNLQMNELVSNNRNALAAPVKTQWFDVAQAIPIEFSVRRDPGSPILRYFGQGPSIQVEIETLPPPAGPAASRVMLDATQDGLVLRALGPSLEDPNRTASYTVSLDVGPVVAQPG